MGALAILQFLILLLMPIVVVAGAVATLFAIGALFWALENPDELRARIQVSFRRPLSAPKPPGKDHYYRPYWAR